MQNEILELTEEQAQEIREAFYAIGDPALKLIPQFDMSDDSLHMVEG